MASWHVAPGREGSQGVQGAGRVSQLVRQSDHFARRATGRPAIPSTRRDLAGRGFKKPVRQSDRFSKNATGGVRRELRLRLGGRGESRGQARQGGGSLRRSGTGRLGGGVPAPVEAALELEEPALEVA